ncbi:MAG: ATP-binding protein [Christensenellales bacterium]
MSIYERIQDEYKARRAQAKRAQQRSTQEVYEALPELKSLREEIVALSMSQLEAVMASPEHADTLIAQTQSEIEALRAQEEALMAAHPALSASLRPAYVCPDCEDTGYIGSLRCKCLLELLLKSGYIDLPLLDKQNFGTFDLKAFPTNEQRALMDNLRQLFHDYAHRFPDTEKRNIYLYGEPGLGKTFLLCCLAKCVLERGYDVISHTSFHFFDRLRKFHIGQSDSIRDLLTCDLLIIDDLGTEPVYKNITVEYLFTVLNERITHNRHTVCATNLSPSEIMQRYGERVCSRLFDASCTHIRKLKGEDLRTFNRSARQG